MNVISGLWKLGNMNLMSTPTTNVSGPRSIIDAQSGDLLGASAWVIVTQAMIQHFSLASLDDDPMHTDPDWAATKGPFESTVAYGFQTMSLLTHMFHSATASGAARDPQTEGYFLNLGFDRMRLVAPVPVNARLRGVFWLKGKHVDEAGRLRISIEVEVEIEGGERPALVGTWLSVWAPPESASP